MHLIKVSKKWYGGLVKCHLCDSIWFAIYQKISKKLKCKKCNNMAYQEPSSVEEWKKTH